jgi:OmpA family
VVAEVPALVPVGRPAMSNSCFVPPAVAEIRQFETILRLSRILQAAASGAEHLPRAARFRQVEHQRGRPGGAGPEAAKTGGVRISATGHADRAGPEDYNMALSLRRADAVREALITSGVSPDAITVAGRGESEPAVPTPHGVKEQANRRVEIVLQ